jgi:ankyrin repeat protein
MDTKHCARTRTDSPRRRPLSAALKNAVKENNLESIRTLLAHSSHPMAAEELDAALMWAAQVGGEETCRLLLDQGANVQAVGDMGRTPLHWAADRGHSPLCDLLIDRGADPDAPAGSKSTALHLAAAQGHWPTCRLLIDRGARLDATTALDSTPLHLAAQKGHEAVCTLLLSCGAPADLRANNRTPASLALAFGHVQLSRHIKAFLQSRRAQRRMDLVLQTRPNGFPT